MKKGKKGGKTGREVEEWEERERGCSRGKKGGDKLIVKERKEERLYIYSWIWLSDSVSIFGRGGVGFAPRPRHTKDVENSTYCFSVRR